MPSRSPTTAAPIAKASTVASTVIGTASARCRSSVQRRVPLASRNEVGSEPDVPLRDGDRIFGVIRGVGLSNDGRQSGFLAPATDGQVRAMEAAYARAGLSPADVQYVECHATGTPRGDAVELESLAQMWGDVWEWTQSAYLPYPGFKPPAGVSVSQIPLTSSIGEMMMKDELEKVKEQVLNVL